VGRAACRPDAVRVHGTPRPDARALADKARFGRAGVLRSKIGCVQAKKAAQIKREWVAKGEPECTHERYDKERILSADTGDWVCLKCGISWWRGDAEKPPPEPS
jgi:hypothetical protein